MIESLSHQPLFAAKLLSGEMPDDIEYVFHDLALSLFPSKYIDLKTECSCPDWSNPCKHIAAVFYLLGEEFDRDPFLLFQLRGITRDEFLARLLPVAETSIDSSDTAEAAVIPPAPLPGEETLFWRGGEWDESCLGDAGIPPVTASLLRRLGNFPFWRGKEPILAALEEQYRRASQQGLNAFLGEPLDS